MAKHRTGHLFKRGQAFYVRWTVDGKVFSKALRNDQGQTITNKREAEDAKTAFMAAFVVGDEVAALQSIAAKLEGSKAELARLEAEQNPALAITDAWNKFEKSSNRPDSGESTLHQYQCQFGQFERWMQEHYKEVTTLAGVTKDVAEEYAAHLIGSGLSPNTYNKHLNLLTLVFKVLKEKAKLTLNPWESIQRKRLTSHSRRELTLKELKDVCTTAKGELRVLMGEGVYTGLRLGDCATLRRSEVDLDRDIIRLVPNKNERRSPGKVVTIPIHPVLRELLVEALAENISEYVLPEIAEMYLHRTDLVTDRIQAHFKACGIRVHKPGTGTGKKRAVVEVGFHSLRHTFVSLCRESNAPLAVVESIVGHSNPAMTRHYTHVGELAAGRAVAALPSIMSDEKPKKTREDWQIITEARKLVEGMTADNWETKQAKLLALLPVEANAVAALP